jgi:3',5'-cyclic AMP phosphodiesterase CpdA
MESSSVRRVLIVANRTAATPTLLDHVKRLAGERPSAFSLLIPDAPRSEHTDWTMEKALPLLEGAAGGPVEGLTGEQDPFEAIRGAVADGDYAEILISTLPRRVSKWLRRDLPHRVEALGLPVTVVTPEHDKWVRDQAGGGPMGL